MRLPCEEKVLILKRHLVEGVAVSDLCDHYQLQPTVFYAWQKQFFENAAAAFRKDDQGSRCKEQQRIEQREEKLRKKHASPFPSEAEQY